MVQIDSHSLVITSTLISSNILRFLDSPLGGGCSHRLRYKVRKTFQEGFKRYPFYPTGYVENPEATNQTKTPNQIKTLTDRLGLSLLCQKRTCIWQKGFSHSGSPIQLLSFNVENILKSCMSIIKKYVTAQIP